MPSPPLEMPPSREYLMSSAIPSHRADPSDSRKLLVLDLNGTLLFRPKRTAPTSAPDGRRLRPVQPRPYIPSFRDYLFHPRTREWLDTMVWSSAQPHSVDDMVNCCFGAARGGFLAVWARDTFGLDQVQYSQKTLTVKDLTKPWDAFPPHSVSSTVMLDDSFRKAQRQPFNHVVLPAYIAKTRSNDAAVWRRLTGLSVSSEGQERTKEDTDYPVQADPSPGNAAKTLEQCVSELSLEEEVTPRGKEEPLVLEYDETLLAIIGILEEIKYQSNVAYWIRAGGLLRKELPIEAFQLGDRRRHMWFEDASLAKGWAEKGKSALKALDVALISGVYR